MLFVLYEIFAYLKIMKIFLKKTFLLKIYLRVTAFTFIIHFDYLFKGPTSELLRSTNAFPEKYKCIN